jgi:hypothetical protein
MKMNDQFDNILDDALAEYRQAAPVKGLDDRILWRVRKYQLRRTARLAWGLAAGLVAALLAVAVWLGVRQPSHDHPGQTRISQPAPAIVAQEGQGLSKHAPQHLAPQQIVDRRTQEHLVAKARTVRAGTRLQEAPFPVRTALTAEERSLLALAVDDPQRLQGLSEAPTEIAIAPIEIAPLSNPQSTVQGEN